MAPSSKKRISKVGELDVLFGRGGQSNKNRGNQNYQRLVEGRAPEYAILQGRNAKTCLAKEIVQELKRQGARFLRKDKKAGTFWEVEDEEFRVKVSQRLRELAFEIKEGQSNKSSCSSKASTPKSPIEAEQVASNEGGSSGMTRLSKTDRVGNNELYQHDYQPDVLLRSSSIGSLSACESLELDGSNTDLAACGSLEDLSDCSFHLITCSPAELGALYSGRAATVFGSQWGRPGSSFFGMVPHVFDFSSAQWAGNYQIRQGCGQGKIGQDYVQCNVGHDGYFGSKDIFGTSPAAATGQPKHACSEYAQKNIEQDDFVGGKDIFDAPPAIDTNQPKRAYNDPPARRAYNDDGPRVEESMMDSFYPPVPFKRSRNQHGFASNNTKPITVGSGSRSSSASSS